MNTYLNRELSWLKFNERVLEEAESREVPLCERLTFASIYQSNLDEFFMVRVGSLMDQILLSKNLRDNKTQMTAEEQIKAIGKTVTRLNRRKDAVYAELMEHLEGYGVRLVNFQKLGSRESDELERYFDTEIAPLTSPTTVSRRQPFPFLQNKEIYAVGVLAGKSGQENDIVLKSRYRLFPFRREIFHDFADFFCHFVCDDNDLWFLTFLIDLNFNLHEPPSPFRSHSILQSGADFHGFPTSGRFEIISGSIWLHRFLFPMPFSAKISTISVFK